MDLELLSVVVASVGAGLVVFLTLPSIWRLARTSSRPSKLNGYHVAHSGVYQDKDGTATEESEAAFSDKLPKVIIYAATILGFATSITSAVLSTVWLTAPFSPSSSLIVDWINVFAWVRPFSSLVELCP